MGRSGFSSPSTKELLHVEAFAKVNVRGIEPFKADAYYLLDYPTLENDFERNARARDRKLLL